MPNYHPDTHRHELTIEAGPKLQTLLKQLIAAVNGGLSSDDQTALVAVVKSLMDGNAIKQAAIEALHSTIVK